MQSLEHARAVLQIAAEVAEHNALLYAEEGNTDQAALCEEVAADCADTAYALELLA